jgi:hypothetical protein
VAGKQVLNAIGAQRSTTSAGKQRFGISSALFANPSFQDRDRGFLA